jgi:hypothetical protein
VLEEEEEIKKAMWEGNVDKLCELAGCVCCCADHTFEHCPARAWEGCRGQGSLTFNDIRAWAAHYNMSVDEFMTGDPEAMIEAEIAMLKAEA